MTRLVRVAIAWLMALVVPLTTYASVAVPCAQHGLGSTEYPVSASSSAASLGWAGPVPASVLTRHVHGEGHAQAVHSASAQATAPMAWGALADSLDPVQPAERSDATVPCIACMAAGCKAPSLLRATEVPVPLAAADPPVVSPSWLQLTNVSNVLERPPSLLAPRTA
jgi:hypothetical protein